VIRHVHVNEMDGGHPERVTMTSGPCCMRCAAATTAAGYRSRLFDFKPGAEKIANDSLRYLEARIAGTSFMSKYVVTGGAGLFGSALVRGLLRQGAQRVIVIDNLLSGREENLEEVASSVDLERADIRCLRTNRAHRPGGRCGIP